MIKFEVMGNDKDDLRAKLAANFEQDESQLASWKKVSEGVAAIVDALPEPRVGNIITACIKLDLAEGTAMIRIETFPSTVMGPMYYGGET